MHNLARWSAIALLFGLPLTAMASGCEVAPLEKQPVACLAPQLIESDNDLNRTYKLAIEQLSAPDQRKLRTQQREWLGERNKFCQIAGANESAAKWHERLMSDPKKARCVVRYATARILELERILREQTRLATKVKDERDVFRADWTRSTGKHYFEVRIREEESAKSGLEEVSIGCRNVRSDTNHSFNFRVRRDVAAPERVVRVFIDLDEGELSMESRGTLPTPIRSNTLKLERGQRHQCLVQTNVPIAPLIDRQFVSVNFGEIPFYFAPPTEFMPWRGAPKWFPARFVDQHKTRRLYFDYSRFDLWEDRPRVVLKQELEPRQEEVHSKEVVAMLTTASFDCAKRSAKDEGSFYLAADGSRVSNIAFPFKLDDAEFNGSPGRFMCVLAKHEFPLPDLSVEGEWTPMDSRFEDVRKHEAIDRRITRGAKVLMVQKDEFATNRTDDGVQVSTVVVALLLNCRQNILSQIATALYSPSGSMVRVRYYDSDANVYPVLPSNRKRMEEACRDSLPPK
jgi:uncharacterized protein YecT (DUF1311 family)